MKTSLIRAYGSEIARENATRIIKNNSQENVIASKKTEKSKTDNNSTNISQYSSVDPNKVITKKEREFFVNMFPQNAEQIQNHVLFNKSGKTSNAAIFKGTLVDGRI